MKKHKKYKKNERKTIEQRKGGGREEKKRRKKNKNTICSAGVWVSYVFFFLSKEEIASISKRLRDG